MTENFKTQNANNLVAIADQFAAWGEISSIHPLGNGNINDTFLVSLNNLNRGEQPFAPTRFVLQRINTQVFKSPQLVMQNMRILSEHVRERLQRMSLNRRWEIPHVILTREAQNYWQSADGGFWRAIAFIQGSESFETLQDVKQATEVGYALGMFHNLISDLPPDNLVDTLEGFHITPRYLQYYDKVLANTRPIDSAEINYCLNFVNERRAWADILEVAKSQGKLLLRLMHGDPKVNNVMFDETTGKAVSIVDLDTVKPGLVHYDIGDCLRSGCNRTGEETQQWESVHFEIDLCQGILQGYFAAAKAFLTENDCAYLYDAIRLIAFELGLRFFSDYLAGNVYFKVKHLQHNLDRALVQFKLTESIERQETTIRQLIRDFRVTVIN